MTLTITHALQGSDMAGLAMCMGLSLKRPRASESTMTFLKASSVLVLATTVKKSVSTVMLRDSFHFSPEYLPWSRLVSLPMLLMSCIKFPASLFVLPSLESTSATLMLSSCVWGGASGCGHA